MKQNQLLRITFYLSLFTLLLFTACVESRSVDDGSVVVLDESVEETAVITTEETAVQPTSAPIQTGVTILADGQIVAPNPVLPLTFNTSGRLLTLNVAVGDVVQEGDLIASLDDRALQDSVASAEANLAIIEAQLAQQLAPPDATTIANAENAIVQAEISLEQAIASKNGLFVPSDQAAIIEAESAVVQARNSWESARDSHEQLILNEILGDIEESARKQAEAAFKALEAAEARLAQLQRGPTSASIASADAQIAQAEATLANAQRQFDLLDLGPAPEQIAVLEAQVAQAELGLAQAQHALADAQLFSPSSGTVVSVETAVGALVGSGSPIVTILDTDTLEFHTTNLSERDLAQIEVGDTAVVTLKTFPNDEIPATISRIGLQATGTLGDAAVFPIILTINSSDLDIRPGMTGRVEILDE